MDEEKQSKFPLSYIVIGIVILAAVGAGGYFINHTSEAKNTSAPEEIREAPPQQAGNKSLSGQKFSESNFASSAYQIYPGTVSQAAKAAMSGWDMKTAKQSDGSTVVSLVPSGSEAVEGDTKHTFTLLSGDKLYFVDLNPNDDKPGQDNLKNDDIGIVVDANGIIK